MPIQPGGHRRYIMHANEMEANAVTPLGTNAVISCNVTPLHLGRRHIMASQCRYQVNSHVISRSSR